MQQPMRRCWATGAPRTLAAGVLTLALGAGAAFADGAGTTPSEPPETVAGLSTEPPPGTSPGTALRPRWIEPQRGEVSPPPEADADWRRDALVLVHAVPGESRLAALVEDRLTRLGANGVEQRAVETPAATDQVRYFHSEDLAMANGLADALEPLFGKVRVRDLTFYRPQPERGTLEVWVR